MTAEVIYEFRRNENSEPEIYIVDTELTAEEEYIFSYCCRLRRSHNGIKELEEVLERERKYVERALTYSYLELGDQFVTECICNSFVSVEELNDLVHRRDNLAMEFFGLENCSDEEVQAWDASSLELLPPSYFFYKDMQGPFQKGWKLDARFPEVSESETLSLISISEYQNTYSMLMDNGEVETAEEFRSNVEKYCTLY